MIVLTAFGSLDIRDPTRGSLATLLSQPRRAALLLYLVVEGGDGFVSRDRLLGLFWPDSDESRGRAALRQALVFLRRALGEEMIVTRGDDGVGVDSSRLRCDVSDFRRALREQRLADALSLYRGEFVTGLLVDDAPAFEQWVSIQRESFGREAAAAAANAATLAMERGAWSEAVSHARQAQTLAPLNEAYHRRLLSCLVNTGDRAGALQEHALFATRLLAELEVAPSGETIALVAELRNEGARKSRERAPAASPSTSDASPDASSDASSPATSPATSDATSPATSDATSPARSAERTRMGAAEVSAVAAVASAATDSLQRSERTRASGPPGDSATRPGRRALIALALTASLVAATLLVVKLRSPESAAPAATPVARARVLVLPLTDETQDSSLATIGRMAADWITEGIARVDGMEVVPATAVMAIEQAFGGNDGQGSSAKPNKSARSGASADASWRRVAEEVGAAIVVRGAVYRERRTLHLQAQLLDAQSGRVLRPVEHVSTPVDSVMAGVDLLRTRVLASLAPLADTVTHLRGAIAPPTYEAYRLYVAGLETFVRGDARRALALFEQSAAADSSYPMPRIAATIMHLNLNDATSAERLLVRLRIERDRLGPLEQGTLDMVQGMLTGDLAATYDAVVRQARIAPGTIGEYMVAEIARKLNRPAEAVSVLRHLGPDRGELRGWSAYWRELTYALHMLSRHDEERDAAIDAQRRYPADADMVIYAARAHAALGDRPALGALFTSLDASPSSATERGAVRLVAAAEWRAHGHAGAHALAREVLAWLDSLPTDAQQSPEAVRQRTRALLLAGNADGSADGYAERALRTIRPLMASAAPPAFATVGLAGVAAAAAGDAAQARRLMSTLEARAQRLSKAARGLSWGESSYWRSAIAAQLGDSALALSLMRRAREEGMGVEPSVHAEPAFDVLRGWPPFAALLVPMAATQRGAARPPP